MKMYAGYYRYLYILIRFLFELILETNCEGKNPFPQLLRLCMFSIIIYYTGMFRTTEARVAVGSSIVVNWTTWQHTQTGNGFIGWNVAASAQCVTTLSCSGILVWVSLKQILYCQWRGEQRGAEANILWLDWRQEWDWWAPAQTTNNHQGALEQWCGLERSEEADARSRHNKDAILDWTQRVNDTSLAHMISVQLISDTINHIWSFPIFKANTSDHWSWQVSWSQFKRRLITWSWISWSQHLSGDCLRTQQWWPGLTRI